MKHLKTSVIALALALLAGCSGAPVIGPADTASREASARSAVASGDIVAARDIYRQLVAATTGDEARRFAVELARAELATGDPAAALATLDAITPPLPDALQPSYSGVRGDALFAAGRTVEAVREFIERGIWLDSTAGILANQERIWAGLALPQSRLAAATRTGDALVDGWLALAPLARGSGDDDSFLAGLIDWRDEFAGHPAAGGILAERLAALRGDAVRPQRIALLLPIAASDVRLRRRAVAVRDGFFVGHYTGDGVEITAIDVFDTSAGGALAAYREAQRSGADFIVGPLLASAVDEILPSAGIVPTLALNVGTGQPAPNFYQFALSSDDEIEAIATRAVAAGHETAIILYARTARGTRIQNSFREAFEARGGRVIGSRSYNTDSANLSVPIAELLNITQSESRYERLRANLGETFEFEPRRRTDIDMVFLQADPEGGPEDARLLVPLLARSGAADIPTYATSEVYDPARIGTDADLDGLLFADLPLLIDPVGEARAAADQLAVFQSRSVAEFRRLYAFGFDAYRLVEALHAGAEASWPLAGATGRLQVGSNGRIRRILPIARFENGRPRPATGAGNLLSAR